MEIRKELTLTHKDLMKAKTLGNVRIMYGAHTKIKPNRKMNSDMYTMMYGWIKGTARFTYMYASSKLKPITQ